MITNVHQLFIKLTLTENRANLQSRLFTNPAATLITKSVLDRSFESCNFWECFMWSLRVFQRRCSLNDNDSIPNFVRVLGNQHKFFVRRSYFTTFSSLNSKYKRDSRYTLFCKFRSSASGDFEHGFSRFHFSPVTHQRKSHSP